MLDESSNFVEFKQSQVESYLRLSVDLKDGITKCVLKVLVQNNYSVVYIVCIFWGIVVGYYWGL